MKSLIFGVLSVAALAGAWVCLSRAKAPPAAAIQPVVEASAAAAGETPLRAEPAPAPRRMPPDSPAQPAAAQPHKVAAAGTARAVQDAAMVGRTVDLLVSREATYGQKQAAWKQLRDAGRLDEAIHDLEQRMAADPRSAEYPSELGQAYLKKCAMLDDIREQGLLALQADKLFDSALAMDPANWEARFTKALAMSHWPESLNKGDEVVQQFETLLQQQESQTAQPHFVDTYQRFGDFYLKAGHNDYARTVWERGARVFPGDEDLQKRLADLNAQPTAAATASGR